MKRSTPEERRWENGLRQGARTSDVSTHCSSRLRRPTTRNGNKNSVRSTPLAATAALQVYLSNDIDAKSRIQCPRPAGSTEKRIFVPRSDAPQDEKRLSNTNEVQRSEIKRQESVKPTQLQVPIHTNINDTATPNGDETSRAESPLSRFQKHIKQAQLTPSRGNIRQLAAVIPQRGISQSRDTISTAKVPATQSLTRYLMDKIQEAKGLRQTETLTKHQGDQGHIFPRSNNHRVMDCSSTNPVYSVNWQTSSSTSLSTTALSSPIRKHLRAAQSASTETVEDLKISPPVPHEKPVIPVIPKLSSPPSPKTATLQNQQGNETNAVPTKESAPQEAVASINDVIVASNAVLSIQRMWRRKRLLGRRKHKELVHESDSHECNEVTLIIDKHSERVTPLYSAAKVMFEQVTKLHQANNTSVLHPDNVHNVAVNSIVNDGEVGDTGTTTKFTGNMSSRPSYHPWTDHELIFLEEGRCIGELQDSVRSGHSLDQDELVWKRPQQVIQQRESQRVLSILRTRRKRVRTKPQDPLIRGVGPHANGTTEMISPIQISSQEPCPIPQTASKSTNSTTHTGEKKFQRKRKLPRVYLLKCRNVNRKSVFCVSRRSSKTQSMFVRVQHAKECDHAVSNCTADREESQSEAASTLDHFVVFSDFEQTLNDVNTKLSRNDLISVGDLALARSILYDDHGTNDVVKHHDVIPLTFSTHSIYVAPSNSTSENLLQVDGQVSNNDTALIATACYSGRYREEDDADNNAGNVDKVSVSHVHQLNQLSSMKSVVTETTTRIHCKYRKEATRPNQQAEAAPPPTPIIPVAQTSQLRLDEDKRIEFLRVLNDFKRCLRSPSSCSSSFTLSAESYRSSSKCDAKARQVDESQHSGQDC